MADPLLISDKMGTYYILQIAEQSTYVQSSSRSDVTSIMSACVLPEYTSYILLTPSVWVLL